MMAGAEVLGLNVRTEDGTRIGTVADVLFDDSCSRVLGFVLRSGFVFRTRRVVGFGEVRRIGPAAIVTMGATPRRLAADELAAIGTDQKAMQGRAVITREGRYVGAVRDVLFDETSGRVVGFEVSEPPVPGPRRIRREPLPADLSHVVADVVIVSEARSA